MRREAMNTLQTVPEDQEGPWDTGELGREEKNAECAPEELRKEIDEALALQMISVRLHKQVITELKMIAAYRGIGYQPLIRDVLCRFTRAEIMQIAHELKEKEKAREELEKAREQLEAHNADLKVKMA
jgi:hypothetical protein